MMSVFVAQPQCVDHSTTTAAQQQQHSSGDDVGAPEEAPLVAPATLPFLVCIVTKFHGVASTPWSCECTQKGMKVDTSVTYKKITATCRLPTS